MQKDPESSHFLYVVKQDSAHWQLRSSYKNGRVCQINYYDLPFLSEDFAFYYPSYGTVVMASKNKIYSIKLMSAEEKVIADYSSWGQNINITRIAISSDGKKMAIVCTSN